MGATLHAGFSEIKDSDRLYGTGVRISTILDDLRKKFGAGGTLHRHDGTAGDGGKVLFSNLATAPTGLTGGAQHGKAAHLNVTDRTEPLPLNSWKMASGTAITNTSSVTLPYYSPASSAMRLLWPANSQIKITQDLLVPDNYSTTANAQAIKAVVRTTAAATQAEMDSAAFIVKGGSAIGTDLNPATVALSTGSTAPEEVSMAITYTTLAKDDLLNVQLFPSGNVTGVTTELFGAFFQYTGDE